MHSNDCICKGSGYLKVRVSDSEIMEEPCGYGPKADPFVTNTNLSDSQMKAIAEIKEALEEIQWLFDGHADIDDDGFPNKAMQVDELTKKALTALKREFGEL